MTKTQRVMNRIVQVDNFQNMACCCSDWAEFVIELAEWGVDGCAKVDFDDPELNIPTLLNSVYQSRKRIRQGGCVNVKQTH